MKMMMTSLKMVLSCACLLILASCMNINGSLVGAAKVFKVGDEFGWQEPAAGDNNITATTTQFYSIWASRNRFQVGDSLSFDYKNDSVVEVEKWGYYHCNSSRPIVAYNNGHSVFNLDRPGLFYFISGNPNHCRNGQRLVVEVMGQHHHHGHHGSPPSIANPPDDHDSYYLAPAPHPSSATALITSVSVVLVIATLVPLLMVAE